MSRDPNLTAEEPVSHYHLAHLNIARALADLESETMSGFVSRLDEINALADHSPGFVWRLQDEEDEVAALALFNDPMLIVNLSVWESIETLRAFVYGTAHVELIRDREAWFGKLDDAHMVLWWVPGGHIPTVVEAREKLQLIRENGPGPRAFTFGKSYPPIIQP